MQLARRIVEEMTANGPTEEELAIVRRQLANEQEVSQRTTRYWMYWLSGMHTRSDTLDGLREQATAYQRITTKEVRDALARYITPERRVTIIGMPRVTAAGGLKAGGRFAWWKITPRKGLISVGGRFRLFTLIAFISFNAIFAYIDDDSDR